jgi:hypothetical protein
MGDGFFTSKGKGLPSKYGNRKVRQAEKFRKSYGTRTPQPNNGCALVLIAGMAVIVALAAVGAYGVSLVFS